MDTKFVGIVLIVCAALLFQNGYDDLVTALSTPPERLKISIQKDTLRPIESPGNRTKLKIHHIDMKYRSDTAHDFLKMHQPNFKTYEDGNIWIEIEILDLPDVDNPGIITQTSIFDLKTNNKISEIGNTYYFKDFPMNNHK